MSVIKNDDRRNEWQELKIVIIIIIKINDHRNNWDNILLI